MFKNDEELIDQIKKHVEHLYENESKGAAIRARIDWVEHGEKNSKYFCGLERSKHLNNVIAKLKNEEGNIVTDNNDILQCTCITDSKSSTYDGVLTIASSCAEM